MNIKGESDIILLNDESITPTDDNGKGNTNVPLNNNIVDEENHLPLVANPSQTNGDSEDESRDPVDNNDNVVPKENNLPLVPNSESIESNADEINHASIPNNNHNSVISVQNHSSSVIQANSPFRVVPKPIAPADNSESEVSDVDDDSIVDAQDNSPLGSKPAQTDTDSDDKGEVSDPDDDGIVEEKNNFPLIDNPAKIGPAPVESVAQLEHDNESLVSVQNNPPSVPAQVDSENKFPLDSSNRLNEIETAANSGNKVNNPDKVNNLDDDKDNIVESTENLVPKPDQTDSNKGGEDGASDTNDDDNDGIADVNDNCAMVANPNQIDTDQDGQGNHSDPDDDNDGIADKQDNSPIAYNPAQTDTDGDGKGDANDTDDDNDNLVDNVDNCPNVANPNQIDSDDDGKGDACDEPCRLYAVHDEGVNDSQLITINPNTLEVRAFGAELPGYDIEALDIHPETNELYAASSDKSNNPGHLYQVDTQTGALTDLGSTGFKDIEALTFHKEGSLWAWAKGDGLILIEDGQGTLIVPSKVKIEGLTWNSDGNLLYVAQGTNLWVYDGERLEKACHLPRQTEALEMLSDNRLLIGVHAHKNILNFNVIDLATCDLVPGVGIPTDYDDVEGIAWPAKACAVEFTDDSL